MLNCIDSWKCCGSICFWWHFAGQVSSPNFCATLFHYKFVHHLKKVQYSNWGILIFQNRTFNTKVYEMVSKHYECLVQKKRHVILTLFIFVIKCLWEFWLIHPIMWTNLSTVLIPRIVSSLEKKIVIATTIHRNTVHQILGLLIGPAASTFVTWLDLVLL